MSKFNNISQSEIDFSTPKLMGVLNVTPDSFSDGNKYLDINRARDRIYIMYKQGVDIVDIGGESTRPGSDSVSETEELNRVMPIIEAALESFPKLNYSIDTTKYEVAKKSTRSRRQNYKRCIRIAKRTTPGRVSSTIQCSFNFDAL